MLILENQNEYTEYIIFHLNYVQYSPENALELEFCFEFFRNKCLALTHFVIEWKQMPSNAAHMVTCGTFL